MAPPSLLQLNCPTTNKEANSTAKAKECIEMKKDSITGSSSSLIKNSNIFSLLITLLTFKLIF